MDVIIDTNIIEGGNYFRSKQFISFLDYLEKTNSEMVLTQIVKDELVSHYKSNITTKLDKIGDISNFCFSTEISIDVDIDSEVAAFLDHIKTLNEQKLLYEIAYDNDFLPEIIHRAINRIKPSDKKGQQFRDTILWLTLKKLLKDREFSSFSLISNNFNDFASDKSGSDLHPYLKSELESEDLKLKYYKNMSDFMKEHADKIEFVTRSWIETELKEIDKISLITKYIEKKLNLAYIHTYKVSVELVDFFVYKMSDEDINLFMDYEGHMTLEMGFPTGEIRCSGMQIYSHLSSKIIDDRINDLTVEDCYWIH